MVDGKGATLQNVKWIRRFARAANHQFAKFFISSHLFRFFSQFFCETATQEEQFELVLLLKILHLEFFCLLLLLLLLFFFFACSLHAADLSLLFLCFFAAFLSFALIIAAPSLFAIRSASSPDFAFTDLVTDAGQVNVRLALLKDLLSSGILNRAKKTESNSSSLRHLHFTAYRSNLHHIAVLLLSTPRHPTPPLPSPPSD